MKHFNLCNVRIQYIYHEIYNWTEALENPVHQINPFKVTEYLEEKEYILRKEDIIYLLKDDSARFFEDSLRIYDSVEKNYFQVSEEWVFSIDDLETDYSLLFWVKPTVQSFKRRIDDLSAELKSFKNNVKQQIEAPQESIKNDIEKLKKEVEMLRLSNQVLFHQLTKIYQRQQSPLEDIPSLTSRQASNLEPPMLESLDSTSHFNTFSDYQHPMHTSKNRQRAVDIALMYSDPLVKKDEYGLVSLGDSVDYEEECNRLIETLKSQEKHINLYFEIATFTHLVNILSLSPTILHIICHGEFDQERQKFYLCFEDEGKLRQLYSEDLKKKLTDVDVKTKIVFVNACHSEEVAKVFYEAGVPCVIAVQSELKIEDTIAQKFSETLYWHLLEGKTIGEAFRHSKAAVSGESVYTCCCAHKHKADCPWYDYAKKEGFEKAHHLHTPTCTNCKFENKFHHKVDCEWAMDFLLTVCNRYDSVGDSLHACCCSPELTHNEALKFKLICSDKSFESHTLFQNREKGKVIIRSNHSCVEQKYPVQRILGRNKELYEIYSSLTEKEKKFVNLYGTEGVGKRSLAKQVANYLFERGHFRDKISIIMLEKTPSIEHFRSELIKEIPGITDWKSFLESIKLNKMLFILEKCDKLIAENGTAFIQDLASIIKSAIHVKFILITNKQVCLNLGETSVWMKELKKLDAAKLLCKNAYAFLNCHERNIYNLADKSVFDMIPLTPQSIWSIAEKLRNKSLDDIAKDIQLEKGRYDEDSQLDKDESMVRTTLDEIKTLGMKTYNLVTFMCLFPGGLSYEDMEELALQERIAANWKWVLISYLKPRKQSGPSGEVEDDEPLGSEKVLDRNDFKPDNYIWINIERDKTTNEIYFKPTQFVSRYIEKNLQEDSIEQAIKKLEYMTLFGLAMIEKAKANFDYNEKLVEFSGVSNFGVWKPPHNTIFNIYHEKNKHEYLNSLDLSLSELKQYFNYHETNFLSCLELSTITNILSIDKSKRDHIVEILEVLCLTIPTLFRVMYPGEHAKEDFDRKAELVRRTIKILDSIPGDPRIEVVKIKLNLFLIALYLRTKSNYAECFAVANLQLERALEIAGDIGDLNTRQAIMAEIFFAKAIYLYKGHKKGLKGEGFSARNMFYKELKEKLKNAESCLAHLPDPDLYKPLKAKLTLLACKARERYNKKDLETKLIDDMKEAQNSFKEYNAQRLLMKIHYMYACLKLELERKKVNNKQNSASIETTKIFTQELVKAKTQHLIKHALDIAKRIKDKSYEGKIKKKIDEFNIEIRHGYFNVITLMRAAPIVDVKPCPITNDKKQETEMNATSFPTRVSSTFKYDLIHALESKNKVLYTKFEILTKEKLKDSILNGCRILHINCHCIEPDYLCVEGEYSKLERIPYEEVREIFDPKSNMMTTSTSNIQNAQHSDNKLDVLILGNKNDRALADFFVELKIPHIITFEFTSNEFDFRHKMLEDECLSKFSIYFYEQIVMQKSVAEAFNNAYESTFDHLSKNYFDEKESPFYAKKIIGEGPILLPRDGDHSEVLFDNTEFPLAKGKIEDISSTRCPTNIEKFQVPYTGRNKEIYSLMKKICEKKGFFKITGTPGSGKTAFVLQVAYYILTRNIFPDGIFYISIKKLRHKPNPNYSLKDLLKETLGLDIESGVKNFFKGKSMLLVFDDFDYFYNKDFESPQLLFPLKDCHDIACIVITTSKNEGNTKSKHQKERNQRKKEIEGELLEKNVKWKLRPLTDEELAHMVMSLIKTEKKNTNSINIQGLKDSALIKNAQGNPKQLVTDLVEKRFEVQKKFLEINPIYEKSLQIEQRYIHPNKSQSTISQSSFLSTLPALIKQGSSTHSDFSSKLSRGHSNISNVETGNQYRSPMHVFRKDSKGTMSDMLKSKPVTPQDRNYGAGGASGGKNLELDLKSHVAGKPNHNHTKILKSAKRISIGDTDDPSFLHSKTDFGPIMEESSQKVYKGHDFINEHFEEEKVLGDTLFSEEFDIKPQREGESLLNFAGQSGFISDGDGINDEDLTRRLRGDEIEEDSAEAVNTESLHKASSQNISFTESEQTSKSQVKSKDDSQNSKKPATKSSGNRTKASNKSGRHATKYQKKKKSNYYQFKEKGKDGSSDEEED